VTNRHITKAVLVDLDDTLLDFGYLTKFRIRYATSCMKSELTDNEAKCIADEFDKITHDLASRDAWGETTRMDRINQAVSKAGIHSTDIAEKLCHIYANALDQGIRLLNGAKELLHEASICEVCLITNGESERQRLKIELLGIEDLLDHIVISGEFGSQKPDPSIFEHALSMTGAQRQEAIMIGDNENTDIQGAVAAGIPSIWINRFGRKLPQDFAKPSTIVPDTTEAASQLRALIR